VTERGPLDFEPDERDRAPAAPPSAPRRRKRPALPVAPRYGWVVGMAAAVLLAVLAVATLRGGTEPGARGLAAGSTIPPFAVPLALSQLQGDANLARKAGQGSAGARPACAVRGPRVLNGCALREGGPFVLAFFATRGKGCIAQLDALERIRRRVPDVRFAGIAIRGDRQSLRALIREHGWGFDIGYDRDGAQITFARRGGRVVDTTFGRLRTAELLSRAQRLAQR
jgi:hypothetical protein